MLISDLNDADNTFVVIQPDEDELAWFASADALDEGGYEVRPARHQPREHDVSVKTAIGHIAGDLTKMADRQLPTTRPRGPRLRLPRRPPRCHGSAAGARGPGRMAEDLCATADEWRP